MRDRSPSWGGRTALGVLLIDGLIGFGVVRYPAVLRERMSSVVVAIAITSLYALASWRLSRVPEGDARTALKEGAHVGLALGALMVVHLTIEYFVDLVAPWNALVSLGLFPVLFSAFAWAGFRVALRTRQWRMGVLSSVWSAMLCMVLLCVYGFLVNYLFMPRLETILRHSPDFIRSGMHDLRAFTVVNSLEACTSHMVIAPLIALFFGGIGGAVGRVMAPRRTDTPAQEPPDSMGTRYRFWSLPPAGLKSPT